MNITSPNWFRRMLDRMKAHKILTGAAAVILVVIGYSAFRSAAARSAPPQYSVTAARIGSITQTVSGTGQISAENQIDVASQVSGTVQSINASVGQHVRRGDLIATIDPHDALISLRNAELSYAKLTAPAKTADRAIAENNLTKAYNDAFSSVTGAFADLSTIMTGLRSVLYDQGGFLSESHAVHLNTTARPMRDEAGRSYDAIAKQYADVLEEYRGMTRASATSSIDRLVSDTAHLLRNVSDTIKLTQNTVRYVRVNQPDYYSRDAETAASNLNTWLSTSNSGLSSLASAQNSTVSSASSLQNLLEGADPLDVQSQELSLRQAQENYQKYFIRAPFDGVIGRIPATLYSQAGGSTVIATVVSDQKIAVISLNEVDAAKVKTGQPVAITFDAIDDFTATGTVSQVDLVGTVSQGVVTYNVKIAVHTNDPRIMPGMSANAVVTVRHTDGVLVVPTAAVKTAAGQSYVQVMSSSTVSAHLETLRPDTGGTGAARRLPGAGGTTTPRFLAGGAGGMNGGSVMMRQVSLTIPSSETPQNRRVATGISDDTNIEIIDGLVPGEWVVTRTTAANAPGSSAPSILNSFGGTRGAGPAVRTGAGSVTVTRPAVR